MSATTENAEVDFAGTELMLPAWRYTFHEQYPEWEKERILAMTKVIREGMTVVEIGAECGEYGALFSKLVGEDGDTILIEPVAKMWPSIRQAYELNDLKSPVRSFVGFASDKFAVGIPEKVDYYNRHVIRGWPKCCDGDIIPDPGFQHLCENDAIPQKKLDDIVGGYHVDVINIDVEGAELNVLHGAEELLRRDRPVIFASLHRESIKPYGYSVRDVEDYMVSLGYYYERLAEDHEIHTIFTYGEEPRGILL